MKTTGFEDYMFFMGGLGGIGLGAFGCFAWFGGGAITAEIVGRLFLGLSTALIGLLLVESYVLFTEGEGLAEKPRGGEI